MNALTAEWVEKAEGDFATAGRELRVRRQPNYDAVCFHAQQTAEKYLKAFLHENGVIFPKTPTLLSCWSNAYLLMAVLSLNASCWYC